MDVTFKIDGLDLHGVLSTYDVTSEISYVQVITTLDRVRRPIPDAIKRVITFTLFPMTDDEATLLYNKLSQHIVTVNYTDPNESADLSKSMYIDSELSQAFALKSIDGKRRYLGGEITLREC